MVYAKVLSAVIVSLVLIAGGLVSLIFIPKEVEKQIRGKLDITGPTSLLYKSFQNSSKASDIYMSYYLWNITNPEEFCNGAMPQVEEVGPYTYYEEKYKVEEEILWHYNATVSYTYASRYHFVRDKSVGSNTDRVYFLDVGFIGAFDKLDPLPLIGLEWLGEAFKNAGINSCVLSLTADEAIYGYENKFMKSLKEVLLNVKNSSMFAPMAHAAGRKLPLQVALADKISNDTADPSKPTASRTGGDPAAGVAKPPSKSRLFLTKWKGHQGVTDYWNTKYANMINGTDGTSFFPGMQLGDREHVFVDTLFRSVELFAQSETQLQDIKLLRMTLVEDMLKNETANPDNAGFGMKTTGFITRPASLQEPVVLSLPHYYSADKSDVHVDLVPLPLNGVSQFDAYNTFLDVEPMTGALFEAHKRIQMNVKLPDFSKYRELFTDKPIFPAYQNITQSTFFPLLWFDQHAVAHQNVLDDFKEDVKKPLKIAKDVGICACFFGAVILVGSVIYLLRWLRLREWKDTHPDLESEPLVSDRDISLQKP